MYVSSCYTKIKMQMHIVLYYVLFLVTVLYAEECGNPVIPPNPSNDKIINGQEAVPHSFPWMVSIQGEIDPHYCGASVISPNWVLTAGHCGKIVFVAEYFSDQVVVGQHDRELMEEEGRQNIEIAQVFLHPQYDQPSSPEKSFDISLLKLKEPAQFSDYVSPPCLPDQDDFGDESSFGVGMECYLSGWGRAGPGEHIHTDIYGQPTRLRQALLPLLSDETCKNIYLEGANFEIQPTMQCAGGEDKTSCNGDSGGPLVCKKENKWYQVGIVSFGPSPCDAKIPAVYTRVAGYSNWIRETIEANGGY